jgi:hypothetical protein
LQVVTAATVASMVSLQAPLLVNGIFLTKVLVNGIEY